MKSFTRRMDLILLKIGLKYTKMMLLICMKMIGDKMMNVLTDDNITIRSFYCFLND
jgi:hypothetical protein